MDLKYLMFLVVMDINLLSVTCYLEEYQILYVFFTFSIYNNHQISCYKFGGSVCSEYSLIVQYCVSFCFSHIVHMIFRKLLLIKDSCIISLRDNQSDTEQFKAMPSWEIMINNC